jgi:hypothetical protein
MKPFIVIVAGHAIYQDGTWCGGHNGEDRFYAQHVEAGIKLHRALEGGCLVLSGGRTRPDREEVRTGKVTNSEGDGMLEYGKTAFPNLNTDNILVESWARDSFENVFFSKLAYFKRFGTWPAAVYIVSWPWKANRFYLISCGLGIANGRFFFRGEGDLVDQGVVEMVTQANVEYEEEIVKGHKIVDPLHRGPEFAGKRLKRIPREYAGNNEAYMAAVKAAYDREVVSGGGIHHPVASAIDAVEAAAPGEDWRHIAWPW